VYVPFERPVVFAETVIAPVYDVPNPGVGFTISQFEPVRYWTVSVYEGAMPVLLDRVIVCGVVAFESLKNSEEGLALKAVPTVVPVKFIVSVADVKPVGPAIITLPEVAPELRARV
jgi:hypothetical protein